MKNDQTKVLLAQNQLANKTTTWLLFLFLGWSYGSLGKIGLQILYYITIGGLGLWTLIRFFTLNGAIKKYNKNICIRLGLSADEMLMLDVI
tara:strand:+ start:148 stop:420 length:273 start_codon:yes stop_codon:yes gene_type:complete